MGFFDKVKDLVSVPDEDYYDGYDEDTVEEISSRGSSRNRDEDFSFGSERTRRDTYDDYRETARPERSERKSAAAQPAERRTPAQNSKVVNIGGASAYQMVLVKPESFGEATSIADHLMNKSTVVLNLEAVSPNAARKLIDFLAGVTYAQNGQFKQVAGSTYVITPHGVDVRGELSFADISDIDDLQF